MILRPTLDNENVLEIDNWVMSCRVFGDSSRLKTVTSLSRRRGRHGHRGLSPVPFPRTACRTLYPGRFCASRRNSIGKWATRWLLALQITYRESHIVHADPRMMDQEILIAFTRILRDLLLDDSIVLKMGTRREDVPNWDSFNYINFIVAVEIEFGVKFMVADIESFPNVGAIVMQTGKMLT